MILDHLTATCRTEDWLDFSEECFSPRETIRPKTLVGESEGCGSMPGPPGKSPWFVNSKLSFFDH